MCKINVARMRKKAAIKQTRFCNRQKKLLKAIKNGIFHLLISANSVLIRSNYAIKMHDSSLFPDLRCCSITIYLLRLTGPLA